MKRPVLHIIFWLTYCVQDILVQYAFMRPILNDVPVGKQFVMAIELEFIYLPLKLLVAYFAMYVTLPSVLNEKRRIVSTLLPLMLIIAISVILYRLAFCYYTNPIVYGIPGPRARLFGIIEIWLVLLDIVPIAAIAVVIKFARMRIRSRDNERSLMKSKLETELKFLRNQTSPHFLFNTLDSIHALAVRKSDETPEVIMKLSKLLNFTLYESRKAMIGVGDEMQILDYYVELESTRFDGKREIDFIREIDNEYEQIAPLLLLSLVEQAFRRGDGISPSQFFIQIDIKLQSGVLNVAIETGRGEFDESPADDQLANIRRQIELLYTDYHLDIEEEAAIFKAGLAINLHSHAEI
jgi:two-component system, LytTR family, sensor kinase